jgi:hypothetical protein
VPACILTGSISVQQKTNVAHWPEALEVGRASLLRLSLCALKGRAWPDISQHESVSTAGVPSLRHNRRRRKHLTRR